MSRRKIVYFSPESLSGLVAWFKADALSLNDGDAISSWTDSSGNGNTATQATGSAQPTFKNGIFNGKPVARFDGGDGLTVANESNFDIETPSVFIVATRSSGTGRIMSKSTTSFSDGRRRKLEFLFTSATNFRVASGADATTLDTTVISTSVPAIYTFRSSSDTVHNINYNGTSTDSTTTLSESSSNFNNASLLIGSAFGAGTEGLTGDIAEIIIFNRYLSIDEALGVQNYLSNKYQISGTGVGAYPRSAVSNRFVLRDFGTCLNFNAGTDRIDLATAASLNISTAITMSAWWRSISTGLAYVVVGYQTAGAFPGYGMRINNGIPNYYSGAQGAWVASSGTTRINNGRWHHVVCFISSTTFSFYVDGALHGTGTSQLPNSWSGVRILGKDNGTGVIQKLDDIRIYNTNLSATEVTNLYYGIEPATTNLKGWWKLDEGSGTTATDSSPVGTNTGTIAGATYSTDVFMKLRTLIP